jgi:hypothetical protein
MKLSPEMSAECMNAITHGIAPDAKLDVEGMEKVLALRARFTNGPEAAAAPVLRYYDPTYYNKALAVLKTQTD